MSEHPENTNHTFDPTEIIDLGKPRGEEFPSMDEEEDKIFFPSMFIDKGIIPGEVGSEWFIKVKVQKTGSNLNSKKEDFDLQAIKVLGPVGKVIERKKSGELFDEAIIVVAKENTSHQETEM